VTPAQKAARRERARRYSREQAARRKAERARREAAQPKFPHFDLEMVCAELDLEVERVRAVAAHILRDAVKSRHHYRTRAA
jgi:hypothetical protein